MSSSRFEGGHGSADLHAGAMAALKLTSLVNEWLLRGLVLVSLASHLVLVLLAGSRRRRGPGVRTGLLWLVYQASGWAAMHSLSNLTLGSTSREQQLVAFWTPFLLMHLAQPDNISAYSLQDNVLRSRQVPRVVAQVAGASFVLYKHFFIGGGAGTLLPASFLMFSLGLVKYVEGALALWRGNLSSIRRSLKQLRPQAISVACQLDNEQALLVAHGLLHICKGAFADYSFRICWKKNPALSGHAKVFAHEWRDMYRVVEMELSLMYDVMYTKAAVVHTWHGYAVRVASPAFTAAAFSLFWSYGKDGQRVQDVAITYVLLVATFLLDVKWLLGALGSTWAYAFFFNLGRGSCWHGLRRFLMSTSLLPKEDPTRYRMWSGTLGQYNLFTEFNKTMAMACCCQETRMEYRYSVSKGIVILPSLRDLLFEEIWEKLKLAYPLPEEKKKKEEKEKKKKEQEEKKKGLTRPDQGGGYGRREELDEALGYGHEFQEVILLLHVATNIFLLRVSREAAASSFKPVKAIKKLSNYMMFLLAVRPNMLPGLTLRSLHEVTRDDLKKVWCTNKVNRDYTNPVDKELALMLLRMEDRPGKDNVRGKSALYDESIVLSKGTQYAQQMIGLLIGDGAVAGGSKPYDGTVSWNRFKHLLPDLPWEGKPVSMLTMLERILDAWVRLLIHASTRCSRDAHANQLSRGGELTTVVWILAEHAGIFRR